MGGFPSLNARPQPELRTWLERITEALAKHDANHPDEPAAPYAVNLIVHKSNDRLYEDLALVEEYQVPIVITSLGAVTEVNDRIHAHGGIVLHDVINNRFAKKAIEKGAQAAGADLAYAGSVFISTEEANTADGYKQMIVDSTVSDIVYTNLFTGVHGNYLRGSIEAAGLDPANLPESDPSAMDFGTGDGGDGDAKAWRDIRGAGQGVGVVDAVRPVADVVDRFAAECARARSRLDV